MHCAIFQSPPERVSTHNSRHVFGTTVPSASSVKVPDECDRTAAGSPLSTEAEY
jgi:hypothetical protein